MRVTDTNVLLRLIVDDGEAQQSVAAETLEVADFVAISAHALCELAWVMERLYKRRAPKSRRLSGF